MFLVKISRLANYTLNRFQVAYELHRHRTCQYRSKSSYLVEDRLLRAAGSLRPSGLRLESLSSDLVDQRSIPRPLGQY